MAVHLAVAGDVCGGDLFCAVHFPTSCLGLDLGLKRVKSIFLPILIRDFFVSFVGSLMVKKFFIRTKCLNIFISTGRGF